MRLHPYFADYLLSVSSVSNFYFTNLNPQEIEMLNQVISLIVIVFRHAVIPARKGVRYLYCGRMYAHYVFLIIRFD